MEEMHKQNRKAYPDKKGQEVREFIKTLKQAGKSRSQSGIKSPTRRAEPPSPAKSKSKEKRKRSPNKKKKFKEDKGPPLADTASENEASHRLNSPKSNSANSQE